MKGIFDFGPDGWRGRERDRMQKGQESKIGRISEENRGLIEKRRNTIAKDFPFFSDHIKV